MAEIVSHGTALHVAPPTPQGFGPLPCPMCGEANASITLDITDLDTLHCADCEADYTVDDVTNFVAKWKSVLQWVDAGRALAMR